MLGKIIINGGINIQWTPITSTDYGEGILILIIYLYLYIKILIL